MPPEVIIVVADVEPATYYIYTYRGYTQKNGVFSRVNKQSISYPTWA
jgi:hypothetical protein